MIQAKPAGWLQTPLWSPELTWKPPELGTLPSWAGVQRLCIDVETRDDSLTTLGPGVRRGGYVCGVAFAIEDGPAHYLPIRHEGGGNLDEAGVWAYLRDNARLLEHEVVFNGAPYDLDYLWENKVEFPRVKFHRDVQVAEPLLDELQTNYNLDAICARRGLPGKDETTLREYAKAWGLDPKKGLWRFHSAAVGPYGERDTVAPLQLLRRQERELDEQDLWKAYDLESRVTPVLMRMTRRGMRIDLDELDRVEQWAKQRLQDYLDQIHHLTGIRVGSISNARELYPALKQRGLDVPMIPDANAFKKGIRKEVPSITKLWLAGQQDDVAKAVVSGREFVKLLNTYVAGYRKHMVGDRIYPSFKQLVGESDGDDEESDGARFGRCAAKHPNVHAQMKRSKEIQKRWRKVHRGNTEDDFVYEGDYASQEPRLTVHYAEICRLPGATQAGNAFRENLLLDPYAFMVELVKTAKDTDLKKLRDDIKEIYLGRCYGMGGGKVAKKLKLPTEWRANRFDGRQYEAAGPEAQAILDRFDRGVPYVRALARRCTDTAKARKYIIVIDGRRLHFELDGSGNIMDEHKALNKLIQGGAAVQTKMALVELDAAGIPLDLTVHDSTRFCGSDDRQAWDMVEIMRNVLPLRVPSRVDLAKGKNYGEMQKMEAV